MAAQNSVYATPLYVGKSRSQTSSMVSRFSRPVSSRSVRSCPGRSQAELTPPATPHGSQEDLVPQPEPQPVFHNFLRAFYPFHPGYSASSSTVTLPMNEGDIILVHSIHTNGWADGTLLVSGARGWLPTNYCEAYDPDHVRSLLKALLTFWDLLRGRVNAELDIFRNQDYVIRGLIAGVRFLLEKSDCLTRESPIIQGHDGLRRNRKALLSDLSQLVKAAKKLQDVANAQDAFANIEDLVDEMILKAFKIVTRAVKFLDIWRDHMAVREREAFERQLLLDEQMMSFNVPPTPPADVTNFPHTQKPGLQTLPENSTSEPVKTPASDNNSIAPLPSTAREDSAQTKRASQTRYSGSALGYEYRPTTPRASRPNSRPTSLQPKRQSLSHRVSYTGQPSTIQNPKLAGERFTTAHDAFLSALASFIGRLQNKSLSTELVLTTQQSFRAYQDLSSIVEAVWAHDSQRTESLEMAKTVMSSKVTNLLEATRDCINKSSCPDDDLISLDAGQRLAKLATDCVKAAGECATKTKAVLEKIGDFEIDDIGLGISDSTLELTQTVETIESQDVVVSEPQRPVTPPQPTSRPPPPPLDAINTNLIQQEVLVEESEKHPAIVETVITTRSSSDRSSKGSLLPPLPNLASPLLLQGEFGISNVQSTEDSFDPVTSFTSEGGLSSNGTNSTYLSGPRDSETSIASPTSTRATTPDHGIPRSASDPSLRVAESIISSHTAQTDDCEDTEAQILEKTFAHELVYNKDGQITGGTLPALVERLTTHDSTPDSMFVSTFYLTFRLFTTPLSFAEALVDRFEYVGETPHIATPVRLRVYNVFKGWVESHWRSDADRDALDIIYSFAISKLSAVLPAAGVRLIELADKVSASDAPLVPRLVSSIGKTNTSISQYVSPDSPPPQAIITKSQLNSLKNWKLTQHPLSVMDFDPLELARQLTLKESKIFCSILPEELLATEWMKKIGSNAVNVRAMSTLSTDLANLVADTILGLEDAKKRAATIKQWVKIANKCLQLNNYDSLMAIICSLNSSTILRLRRTWEIVSQKTKITLENLRSIMDVSKNYSILRARLNNQVPPCLPFVGTYLTDLTFVDVGCQTTRRLPGDGEHDGMSVINFAKHTQTAKIIGDLQRFQIPYRLTEVPELQEWMEAQIQRVQASDEANLQNYYRRSLVLEPREQAASRPSPVEPQQPSFQAPSADRKFDFLSWTHSSKEKSSSSGATTPI
ncbi:MAG: hypothetical protein M1814_002286 [Vezdaea aestivalis]|nr:MAG: hypothetical protein M1814_002286 [Vezdaea aestivalis]